MTVEDIAFDEILDFLQTNQQFEIISAHPPSGKSYFTDLIRIPIPDQNSTASKRAHIDLIFCSDRILYLCEVKGTADESAEDIEKLREICSIYSLRQLQTLILSRLSYPTQKLPNVGEIVIAIGATKISSHIDEDILYIVADENLGITLEGKLTSRVLSDFKFV